MSIRFFPKLNWLLMTVFVVMLIVRAFLFTPEARAITPCRTYDPAKEDPAYCADDERVNPFDEIQTMTAYCLPDHSLQVYAVIKSKGTFLFNIPAETLANELATAKSTGKNIMVKEQMQRQVWALANGKLQLHDYSSPGYDYQFPGDLCGLVPVTKAIPESKSKGTPVPNPTKSPSPSAQTNKTLGSRDTVTTGRLTIRNNSSSQGDVLGYIPSHTALHVIGRDATWNWIKVSHNGVTGWVSVLYSGVTNDDLRQLPVLRD